MMKGILAKLIVGLLAASFMLACSTSMAEPTQPVEGDPSPSPTATTQPGLVSFRSTGEMVVRIQLRLRELGYFNFKPTGNFQNMSVEKTIAFQQMQSDANGLPIMADGTVGAQSSAILFSTAAKRADITASIPIGPQLTGKATLTGELVKWDEVKAMLSVGTSYSIVDYNTGAQFDMVFCGGENHAEMECTNAADTAAFKQAFGNAFNYSKRPVVITIGGRNIAASLQGFPHGTDIVSANDMDGHACLFFEGSLSHVGLLPDVEHLNQVYKAAGR